jgi:hypothetical protein
MGTAQALELGHLVSRWSGVASGTECFPCNAWKTLPVQPVGTDRTVSVEIVKHGESHLYKIVTLVRPQREQYVKWWSSGSSESNFITKNPEPHKFPQIFPATPNGSSTHLWYSKVELDQKETRWKDARSRCWFVKTAKPRFALKGATQGWEKLWSKIFASRN